MPIVFPSLDGPSGRRTSTRRRSGFGRAVLLFLVALAAAACSSGQPNAPVLLSARQLTTRILPAPYGYEVDPTPHASGVITPALFDEFGGVRSPSTLGFVTGFKQNYLDTSTGEGLIVTVMEFMSSKDARTYFTQTRPGTLSYARATIEPFPRVPGAFEANGTKPYNHGYYHAIVDTASNFYFQVAYANAQPSLAPIELGSWAKLEYLVLDNAIVKRS